MQTLSVSELAKKTGVSERALRFYETKGLLAPLRTASRQRAYRYDDILRLQQIQLLKRAGFTLAEIQRMTQDQNLDARQILGVQKEVLTLEADRVARALGAVSAALERVEVDADLPVSLSTLCNIIKTGEHAMGEEKWQKVWDKFYTKEEQEKWRLAKEAVPESVRKAHEAAWPELIGRTEALIAAGAEPAGEQAKGIAKEWTAMSQAIFQADPSLSKSAAQLYNRLDEWPSDGPQAPFSKDLWIFIQKASEAAGLTQPTQEG